MKKPKKEKDLNVSFSPRSRKKSSLVFRLGGKFISRKEYLEKANVTESQLKFIEENVVNPATKRGTLLKRDKKNVADLFNSFVKNKKNLPQKYNITINLNSLRSMISLKNKDIFVYYKEKEFKFTFNDLVYFSAQIMERFDNVFYSGVKVEIDEEENSAKIKL